MALASDRLSATDRPARRAANGRLGLGRLFTSPGVDPYDEVVWERRDARITNWKDGTVAFEQLDVEFPTTWSINATNIVAQKYFRGTLGTPQRESSLRQVVDRVVNTITTWGREGGYFQELPYGRGITKADPKRFRKYGPWRSPEALRREMRELEAKLPADFDWKSAYRRR